mgnify:CR=1 FL=1
MPEKYITYYEVEPLSSIRELLDKSAAAAPDTAAFRFKENGHDVSVTYPAFRDDTEALGASLTALGCGASHIACYGRNSYRWAVVYLAVLKSAGVYVPIDRELPADDVINILNHSDSEVLFCDAQTLHLFTENRARIPGVKHIICLDTPTAVPGSGVLLYDSLLAAGYERDKRDYDALKSDENALKLLVYTSGTTGLAKGVMLSEHNLVSSIYYGLQVSTVFDTCLSVLPYHHTYEAVSGLLVSLHMRSTICINDKLRNVLKNIQYYKPSYVYLVPAFAESFYKKINESIDKNGLRGNFNNGVKLSRAMLKFGIDLRRKLFSDIHEQFGGRLRKLVCGGAPIRPEIGRFFEDIGISLINGYGITECSPLVSANWDKFNDPATVGFNLPCIDMRIDAPTPEGIGEICVRGDVVMLGYYKDPEQTGAVMRDGWFYTGDYGMINKYGQLVITGRKKNIIVLSNGKNIYPEEIEALVARLPYVTDVIVRADKNEHGEQSSLTAEIFCADGFGERSERNILTEIRRECSELPSYKIPSKLSVRTEPFVKTTTNKIKR